MSGLRLLAISCGSIRFDSFSQRMILETVFSATIFHDVLGIHWPSTIHIKARFSGCKGMVVWGMVRSRYGADQMDVGV